MHRRTHIGSILQLICLPLALAIGCATGSTAQQTEKIKITKLDDLPQHTYPFTGKVLELVQSDGQTLELAEKVRADVESDLATYEIGDATTLQNMYGKLLTIDLVKRDYDAALDRIKQIAALEDKEPTKLMTGLTARAMIAARREVGQDATEAVYRQAFRRHLAQRAAKLPWAVVQDEIQSSKGRMEIFSENLIIGIIQAQVEPTVAKTGELSADQAAMALRMHYIIRDRLPLKDQIVSVYQELIDANTMVKPDIWADRAVTLTENQNFTPVLLGVWDSGTDPKVFKDILFVNPNEKLNGMDYDGNGFVDDIHGIAYDIHANKTTELLCPLGEAAGRMPQVMKHIKGLMDLQAAVDSPEATALKKHLSSLDPAEVKGFFEDLGLAGNYAHGTHVAGIMTEGNPFARLLIARLSYDYHSVPVARTVEWGKRDGAKCRKTVDYFKQHGVRVVNMSWGEALEDAEDSLEKNGIGDSAEERREIARKVFAHQKEGLYEAIKNAPDILFVCAAGNADNDVEFDDYIASSFDLPNLLVVGAVDQAGEPTSFTSSGRTVQVYGNGFEVESYVPGGQRMKMSGTSMASPNVANLAGKMLSKNPSLTPKKVIHLIKEGADKKTVGDMTYLLMNPKRTLDLL